MIKSILCLILVLNISGCHKPRMLGTENPFTIVKVKTDPEKPFVLVEVKSINVSLNTKCFLNIHVEGVVPKSGYLAEMLIWKPSEDDYIEYIFQAIPNVEGGVVGPTTIIVDTEYLFNPNIKGVRVFGAEGSIVEAKILK